MNTTENEANPLSSFDTDSQDTSNMIEFKFKFMSGIVKSCWVTAEEKQRENVGFIKEKAFADEYNIAEVKFVRQGKLLKNEQMLRDLGKFISLQNFLDQTYFYELKQDYQILLDKNFDFPLFVDYFNLITYFYQIFHIINLSTSLFRKRSSKVQILKHQAKINPRELPMPHWKTRLK